jgi:hypothetical protein
LLLGTSKARNPPKRKCATVTPTVNLRVALAM